MTRTLFCLFLISFLILVSQTQQQSVQLTDSNWDEKIRSGNWIVNLYVPWCQYSQDLLEEWEQLSERTLPVTLGHVDCSQNHLCEKLFLDGFPTILHIKDSRYTEYTGDRTAVKLSKWIKGEKWTEQTTKLTPKMTIRDTSVSSVVTLTDKDFDKSVKSGGVWLVEFYAPWCGHCKNLAPVWEEVAHELEGIAHVAKVDCTTESDISNRFSISSYPTIKLIRDGMVYPFTESRKKDEFFAFVDHGYKNNKGEPYPEKEEPFVLPHDVESKVVVLTKDNFDSAISHGVWIVEFYAPWCIHCQNLAPIWEELAYKHSNEFNVGKVNVIEESELGDRFEIDGFPMVKVIKDKKVYDYAGDRSIKAYVNFVNQGYLSVEAEPLIKEQFVLPEGESKVVVLTDDNFDQSLTSSPNSQWLIEFYAPWCGHCKKLAPTWEELAYKYTDSTLKIAKVDATEETETAARFGVKSYPTVFLVKENNYYLYQGPRKVKEFVDFVKSNAPGATATPVPPTGSTNQEKVVEEKEEEYVSNGDSKVVVLTDDNFYGNIKEGTWMIKFYAPWCGHCKNFAPTWDSMAEKHADLFTAAKLDATVHTNVAASFGVQAYPTMIMIKGNEMWKYEGNRQPDDIIQFITSEHKNIPSKPVPRPPKILEEPPEGVSKVVILTDKNFDATVKKGKWFVEFYAPWCGHCKQLQPVWEKIAYNYEKLNMAKVDATVETGLASRFNIQSYPTLKLIHNKQVYEYDKYQRDADSLVNWATDGYLETPSQPLKAVKNEKSNVVVLRDNNFDRKVKDGVWFVKFYAPWCGHCKAMAPAWEQLSQQSTTYVVADVDATIEKGLAKRFQIQGFPSLKLFKDGKMYEYLGERNLQEMQRFAEGGYLEQDSQPMPESPKKKKTLKFVQEEFL